MAKRNAMTLAVATMMAMSAICTIAVMTPAQAADQAPGKDDSAEYAKLGSAKLSLAEASTAAEKQFGGKAVNAAFDNEQQSPIYEVELMSDARSKTVAVNGQTGEVKEVADSNTGENGHDGQDDE